MKTTPVKPKMAVSAKDFNAAALLRPRMAVKAEEIGVKKAALDEAGHA